MHKLNRADKISEFLFNEKLPYDSRIFFVQHLVPYDFFSSLCKGKNILEIGIGEGFGSYYLSKFANKMVGLDIDFSRGPYLKKYIDRYETKDLHFINADGIVLPFKDASFERVISCQVIEHVPENRLRLFLEEIKRVLKRGGLCLISTLNVEHNIKNPLTYEKFYQHHKEFNRMDFEGLLNSVFTKVKILGLGLTLKHRFYRRLKRWGFLNHRFYNNILPQDFIVSGRVCRDSLDLIGLCTKE